MKRARVYLAVPYDERVAAKRAGARWDDGRKAWYTDALTPALEPWRPDHLPPIPLEVDPQEAFASAMREIGLVPDRAHPIADGLCHRVRVDTDHRRKKSGFYVLHVDGLPNGYALNHKTGEQARWRAKAELSETQKAQLRAHAAQQAESRDERRWEGYLRTAAQCSEGLRELVALKEGDTSAYLERKGVVAYGGLYASHDGKTTYVPMHDLQGQLWSVQTIPSEGTKMFVAGGRARGCFHVLGGLPRLHEAARSGVVVLAEGYATAATVAAMLDCAPAPMASVAALFADNLLPVAQDLRRDYPQARIIIAADDDRGKAVNAGRACAEKTAATVGARVALPPFTEQHPRSLSDWNDLDQHPLPGYDRAAHRRQLQGVVLEELATQQHDRACERRIARRGR